MLPPAVAMIPRDSDGYYQLEAGWSGVFTLIVPWSGSLSVITQHTDTLSQDHSLRVWFSEKPYGMAAFFGPDDTDVWNMRRQAQEFTVWDDNQEIHNDIRLLWPSSKPLYLNVQNLQNTTNTFKLIF